MKPGDGVCSSDEPADRLTAPWVISSAGTGGKVCRSAQSVHLAFGGVRRSPGRLTDERSDRLPTSSCSPPHLAARCHPDVKRRLIFAAVSCYDSSLVNVWTRLFRRHRLASLCLYTSPLWSSSSSSNTSSSSNSSRTHPAHTFLLPALLPLPSRLPQHFTVPHQFYFCKN